MLQKPNETGTLTEVQSIDTEKLVAVFRKNLIWVILILIATNLTAYLTIRYTKDLFESESEMKLDIKRDATELGIKTYMEDQNMNLVSGEIEQIKSKLFFNKVLDSLDIAVSYYSLGKVLTDEMYKRSSFEVKPTFIHADQYDKPIFIEFKGSNEFSLRLDDSGPTTTGVFGQPVQLYQTSLTVFKKPNFIENDGNNYFFVLNSRKSLINYLSKNIQVDPLSFNANTIRVSFRDHNARKAFDIVNKIDSLYINYSNQQKNLANKQKIDWLNNELVQVEKKMEGYEDYFENFTLQNKSNDLTVDLKKTIAAINVIDSQRYSLNKRLADLNNHMDLLTTDDFSIGNRTSALPATINQHLEELIKKARERDKLALAYNENTFAFRQKEKEVSMLKDELFNQLSNLKKEWLADLVELGKRKEKLERAFAEMPDKNTQFSKNQRYYKLYEEFYLTMMQSKAEFEIAQAGSTPDFKILSPATLPTTPISPSKIMVLGIGFVAGIILNIFFIGLMYVLNNKITSVKEVERGINLPMLGAIPASNHTVESLFHVIDNPKSIVSEAIRTLRTNLEFFNTSEKSKVITITSTISGEGKSFLAMNLGGVLALSRKRVVLVDLDMRKPKSEKYPTGNDSPVGMSTVLIKKNKWQECVVKTSLENFDFIPSGPHPPNPSELLLNGEFSDFLEELRANYDYVVIDTPPVGLVTDGVMAMKRSDLSIYVFRANYSHKDFLQNLARVVTLNKLTHVASVLNAIPLNGKYYGYGYYEDKTPRKRRWTKMVGLK
ncbi:MAG: polysaccharide biosynthesis tyrosine autokinase [Cyclobacteriaceae bacterium]|nr:polysaccharide biosynthesis tyrosine autokinase [Cyclobacteriaceae bacterium]